MNAVPVWLERYRAAQGPATGVPAWLADARDAAWQLVAARGGLPGRGEEAFKYTSFAALAGHDFEPTVAAPVDAAALPEAFGTRLTFVDGRFNASLSELDALPAGVTVRALRDALTADGDALARLYAPVAASTRNTLYQINTALADNGVVVDVAPDAAGGALELLFVASERAGMGTAQPRVLVRVGAHASLTLIERHRALGESQDFTNVVTEVAAARGARVTHLLLQRASLRATVASGVYATVADDARFDSHAVHLGAALVRADIDVTLAGRGAACGLYGLHLAGMNQHVDTHTRIEHAVPDTKSDEHYRAVVDRGGRSVFNGKVLISVGADRSDAQQYNANLLLSEQAEADTKPELEIYADDVKASHGATVGKLDETALFYLRTRGIGEAEARAVLVWAFADTVLSRVPLADVRRAVEAAVLARLPDAATIQEFR